jgi:hypothetical protein
LLRVVWVYSREGRGTQMKRKNEEVHEYTQGGGVCADHVGR